MRDILPNKKKGKVEGIRKRGGECAVAGKAEGESSVESTEGVSDI